MRSIVVLICFVALPLALLISLNVTGVAQEKNTRSGGVLHTTTRPYAPSDTVITLPHEFIVAGTEIFLFDSLRLDPGRDYILDARYGKVTLLRVPISDTSAPHLLTFSYTSFPFVFRKSYARREPMEFIDSLTGKKGTMAVPTSSFSIDEMFGSNLQKSGSILRGFTVGSNQDLSLNSGFRMQMSGNLTSDLTLVAALTDENSPIQPEGTTQTLQEVDNVFIELRGTRMAATLGDFSLNIEGNEFGRIHRKLQGGKAFVNYGSNAAGGDIVFAGAAARGKFTTNEFQGVDGVQGPYLLTGKNGERTMIVIAGTERVYVNGELMTRGELADYVIDYANAEVTFKYRRLISAVSRIAVDFEYSDKQYPRSLVGGKAGVALINGRFRLNATILRESDDENSPIDASLSDADKDTLAAAGGDQSKAVRSGVVYVGPGLGQYLSRDTTYFSSQTGDTVRETFYRYAPDSTALAVYLVTFSGVGAGRGSYNKITSFEYLYVGKNAGSYLPVRVLPLPQSTSLADVDFSLNAAEDLTISGEYAGSKFNANKFSQDAQSDGSSNKLAVRFAPENLRIGTTNLGSLDLRLNRRFIGSSFVPIDRVNEIEFNRKWNSFDTSKRDEELLESMLAYRPAPELSVGAEAGSLKHGDGDISKRYSGDVSYRAASPPEAGYAVEYIKSRRDLIAQEAGWFRQRAHLQDTLGMFLPAVRYEGENLLNTSLADASLEKGTFRFNEVTPSLGMNVSQTISVAAELGWRWDDSLNAGALQRASKTFSQNYHFTLREWNALSSTVDVTMRKRVFTPLFTHGGQGDIPTFLVRMQTRYNPFARGVETEWYYEGSTERSARLERVFQNVTKGTGNYIYAGDANNNHRNDPEEYVLSRFDADYILLTYPTDELLPVVNLKASTRIRFNGPILFSRSGLLGGILPALSAETYLRVEEKSTTPVLKDIYLLHLGKFLNNQTTLNGANIVTQDAYYQENDPEFSLRLRYLQRNGLTQYALSNERTYARQQSFRLRCRFVEDIANETTLSLRVDNLSSPTEAANLRGVAGTDVTSKFSYKFDRSVDLSFTIALGTSTNYDTTAADMNDEEVEAVFALAERAQARIALIRDEVVLSNAQRGYPFELTNGKVEGHTWQWKASTDYRFGQYVQATLAYDGRSEGTASPVHTVRATVRAFF